MYVFVPFLGIEIVTAPLPRLMPHAQRRGAHTLKTIS